MNLNFCREEDLDTILSNLVKTLYHSDIIWLWKQGCIENEKKMGSSRKKPFRGVEDVFSRGIEKNLKKPPCPWGEFSMSRGKFLCSRSQFDAFPGVKHVSRGEKSKCPVV